LDEDKKQRDERHVKMKAKIIIMLPKAKEHQGVPTTPQKLKEV
jgi:hypothetical protein